jgi:hypothetical protein
MWADFNQNQLSSAINNSYKTLICNKYDTVENEPIGSNSIRLFERMNWL